MVIFLIKIEAGRVIKLMGVARSLYTKENFGLGLDQTVYALDSTIMAHQRML